MFDRCIRAALVIVGVSVGCAWTWPGAFPDGDPVAVLVRLNMPIFYRAVVAWYYVAPGVAAFLTLHVLITTSRIWFARISVSMGLRSRLPTWPLSPQADGPAIVVGEVHHPTRAEESTGPGMAHHPGAGTLYRRGDFWRGRVRQDLRLSAPVRPPTLELASRQSRPPRRRAHPGSEGRFLSRHPPDADRAGPGGRLHRAEPRWPHHVEPAECDMARFVLPGLHGRVPLESALWQGERALLATGLYEPRPLDYRAVPRAARSRRRRGMGDAARRVPLRHRQDAL